MIDPKHSALSALLRRQLAQTPEQEPFFAKRFAALDADGMAFLEDLASKLTTVAGSDLDALAGDYGWMCGELLEEELYFRRNKTYRRSNFQDVLRDVYRNHDYMSRYLNGLLLSQLWWSNHAGVLEYFCRTYVPSNAEGYSHLEIGPGHGLFLYFAAADPRCAHCEGWDVSQAAIDSTRAALTRLGVTRTPTLKLSDLFAQPEGSFESITFSEVLEHLDRPTEALDVLRSLLAPGGRMFVNMPINSPAPDHIFNLPTPEAVEETVAAAGFKILDRRFFPATNQSLEVARAKRMTISCALIAQRR